MTVQTLLAPHHAAGAPQVHAPTPGLPSDFTVELPFNRLHYAAKGRTLIVSFDNAGAPRRGARDRPPWGHKFFSEEGHSVLGVIAYKPDWYRDPRLHAELLKLRSGGFFAAFDAVVMVGGSMGGFGATAFASLAPRCRVLSYNPQSTLRRDLVPWETGYAGGRKQDWSGAFADGPAGIVDCEAVYILYDPFLIADRRHAERYGSSNVRLLRTPFLGHGLPGSLLEMGLLKEIMRRGINGTLDEGWFYSAIRTRKTLPKYRKELIKSAVSHGKVRSGIEISRRAYAEFEDPFFGYYNAIFTAAGGDLLKAEIILDEIKKDNRKRRKTTQERRLRDRDVVSADAG